MRLTVRLATTIVAFFAIGFAAFAQDSVPVAAHEQITIAAWNLEWFFDADKGDNQSQTAKEQSAPNDSEYKWRVKEIATAIASFKPTILALSEIENKKVLNDLAERLKTHHQLEYDVGFIQGKDTNTEQDVAFLVLHRPGTQAYSRVEQSGLSFNNPNLFKIPSKHVALTVVHATPTDTQKLTVIALHLKAGGTLTDEEQRKRQARTLHRWAKKLMSEGHAVIILGDTNVQTAPDLAKSSNAIGILRGLHTNTHADDLADLHEDLPPGKIATHVSGKALDRILLSPKLLDETGLVFKEIAIRRDLSIRGSVDDKPMFSVPQAERDLSDHFPLVATFEYVP
jgi:endonuclease/exonuclease/phosphatase family metal-dependent hydrolase